MQQSKISLNELWQHAVIPSLYKLLIGHIYTRRRLRRPDALNMGLLSASLCASCFCTRHLNNT